MGKLYTIRDACKILQLNPNTLRKWDREGKIKCIRLSNNFRRIPESEINRTLGVQNNRKSFIYARVSSHDQKADLDRQIQKLQTASPESDVIFDIRGGMKFNTMVIICCWTNNYFCWKISPKIRGIGTFMAYVAFYSYA